LQIITVAAEFQAGHNGYYEIELCPQEEETDTCFQKLTILGGSGEVRDNARMCVDCNNCRDEASIITAQVQLPEGVTCSRCTMRWTYRTSYPGGGRDYCWDPEPAQTFR
jgi:hypothetical protein